MVNISSIGGCSVILQHCSFYMVPVMVNLSSFGCCKVILQQCVLDIANLSSLGDCHNNIWWHSRTIITPSQPHWTNCWQRPFYSSHQSERPTTRAAQLAELSTTAGYPWKLSMSAYLQNFATKNAVFTNLRNKNAVFTHFRDKNAVFTHFCVKNLWFHRYVTICLTRASTYTFRSCFVIILSPQVRA